MARWLVQLTGERADLEEFPRWFPDGDVFAIEESEAFYLVGPAFEVLPQRRGCAGRGRSCARHFTAIISLLWPSLRKPTAGRVVREVDGGRRDVSVFLSAGLSMRSKVSAVGVSAGVTEQKPQRTQAQELLMPSVGRPHLELALSLWADQQMRIMEEIENVLGKAGRYGGSMLSKPADAVQANRGNGGGLRTGRKTCDRIVRFA